MSNISHLERMVRERPFGWEFIDPKDAPYYFSFEEIREPLYWQQLVETNWKLALYAGAIYIVTIFGVQRWMRDRPPFQLRGPLFCWSFCLGTFSVLGFVRILPGFVHVLGSPGGFYKSICAKKCGDVAFGFWILLFVFSKFVELGDTLFTVLRKKPLMFLHWYHHVVTMSVVWILAPLAEPITRWYAVLNFGVHSLIYPYLAVKALGIRAPSWVANFINSLEVAQMLIGLGVGLLSVYYQKSGYDCVRYPISIQLFGWVYLSFLLLFGKLFYQSIFRRRELMERKNEDKKVE